VSLADVALGLLWLGVVAYVLFGGADFGAGIWDLLAGRGEQGRRRRDLIEHVIGPVWETNHVWLIFVVVIAWTAFPRPSPRRPQRCSSL
jgi:cytochrome d ubiquinol oxidase subunit II